MTVPGSRRRSGRPGLRTALLSVDDARWAAALSHVAHDAYQLPEYLAFASRHQVVGTPVAYLAEAGDRRLLIPLVLRPTPGDAGTRLMDATSPRGFPGLVTNEALDGPGQFLMEALQAFGPTLRDRGVVDAFIRLHPLLGAPHQALARYGDVVDMGHSFSIDLTRPDDVRWGEIRLNHRRDIRHASRAGYAARMDAGWDRFDAFVDVFQRSMARLDAQPHWRLSREYLADLRGALGDRLHLCVVEKDGELAAASLITECDGIVEYHLAGTADEHLRASPSKLLIHFVSGWARARGDRVLHLAGSPSPGDSLSHFKAGFGPRRHPVRSWRLVADPAAYETLVRDWELRTDGLADRAAGFFPAYRSPAGPPVSS